MSDGRMRWGQIAVACAVATLFCLSCLRLVPLRSGGVRSHAYKGHAQERDTRIFVSAYPAAAGSRLDDCQTCHKGGMVTAGSRRTWKNPCDFCHLIPFPSRDSPEAPHLFKDTLNPYGLQYEAGGRSIRALRDSGGTDSDGDGFANDDEIRALTYPGAPESRPGQTRPPTRILEWKEILSLPPHTQFMLVNTTQQEFDYYATYTGVRVVDLLSHAGVDVTAIDGVTVIAPDGYRRDFTREELTSLYPCGVYHGGLDRATLGKRGFVEYPPKAPPSLADVKVIPMQQRLLIGYQRDEAGLTPVTLDPASGGIEGEGPYRVVVPPLPPGDVPDRGSKFSPSGFADGYDYDPARDHNAGAMVRGVVALRVNPLPAGCEDFDYHNGGWTFVEKKQLVIYGCGVRP